MNILYIDGVGPFGGASRSLFEMLKAGDRSRFRRMFLVQQGTANDYYRQVGDDLIAVRGISRLDNTQFGYYRRARWLILLREIFYIPFTIGALLRAKRRWRKIDVVHANEVLEIVPAIAASLFFRAPLVVHVRSPQRRDWRSFRSRLLHGALRRFATKVIAIDEGVRATLPPDLDVSVIHNSFVPEAAAIPDERLRATLDRLGRTEALTVGFVGNLHASKGVDCILDAAEILMRTGRPCTFLMVGGHTARGSGLVWRLLNMFGLAQNQGDALIERLATSPAREHVHLLGATSDIDALYSAVDVVVFPSHFDAPGRPVFEAAFYGVPSVVAVRDPYPDTLVDGVTGLAIAAPDGAMLAEALARLDRDRGHLAKMGDGARVLAKANFSPFINTAKIEAIYESIGKQNGYSPSQ